MTNVTICAPFRDAEAYIDDFIDQVYAQEWTPSRLRVVCIEGDSTDNTRQLLADWSANDSRVTIVQFDTGRDKFPSIIDAHRFYHLSQIFNAGLEAALVDDWADYVCFSPGDVAWPNDMLQRLTSHKKDLIAPMFWVGDHLNGSRFYDIWGFRRADGWNYLPNPYNWYEAQGHLIDEPVEMATIGGVAMIARPVLDAGARYGAEDVDHGLCKSAIAAGFTVWSDPKTHIRHR